MKKKDQTWPSFWYDIAKLVMIIGVMVTSITGFGWKFVGKPQVEKIVKEKTKKMEGVEFLVKKLWLVQIKTVPDSIINQVEKESKIFKSKKYVSN